MSQTQIALLAVLVTIFGWYATYFYTKRREDRTRRVEVRLKHMERQIDELYGPLHALIQQIFAIWTVREQLLQDSALTAQQKQAATDLIWQDFFRPIHEQIQALLRTKLHLVQGRVPYSFEEYLQHAVNEATRHALFDKLQINTAQTTGKEWPKEFSKDVFLTLRHIREAYDESLRRFEVRSELLGLASWFRRRRWPRARSRAVPAREERGLD